MLLARIILEVLELLKKGKGFHIEIAELRHGGRRERPAIFSVHSVTQEFNNFSRLSLRELCVKRSAI